MRIAAALALAGLLVTGSAQAQKPCITGHEAEAFALVALPEIIQQTGIVCVAELPPESLVRRPSSAFLAKYRVEADRAWPEARAAIVKLSDPMVEVLLQSDYARPLLTTLLVPQLVGRIATRDCATIDRMVTLLEPLPPRNTAGIVVATLQYLKSERARGKNVAVPDLPLCAGNR